MVLMNSTVFKPGQSNVLPASQGTLVAYVGTSVCGVKSVTTNPPFGPFSGKPLYQVVIYGDGHGDELTFQYDINGNKVKLTPSMIFSANNNKGNALNPIILTGGANTDAPLTRPIQPSPPPPPPPPPPSPPPPVD